MKATDIALKHIRKLYAIEKEAKSLTIEERFQLRQEKAKPILDNFGLWLGKIPVTNDEDFKELLPTRVTQKQIDNYLAKA
ncbi:MAG: transposase [Deltaproteobacteria bacterium]|nr:transposase [Candidatus Tharpella aukensis]